MSKLSKLTDEELLAKAHRLALESLVEQMEEGEYISSGNLSYLNTLSKNSGIKAIKEEAAGNDIGTKIQDLIGKVGKNPEVGEAHKKRLDNE